ncbi:putative PHD type zinc finger protein with BAH domain-containing protein [Lithohypha guttulata]|uniref:PHD type zinc finger protein with BAH domain-containing protein n=1 Tax=Lithohypha guttulata TaxID=1690604 RepID=A0ABR0KFM9_9EURO|nr:putative PHD type zinc finger protein with BAH domain-containing protein [Lithohypha guttulata]
MSSTSAAGAASESATYLGDIGRASTSNAPSPTAVSNDLTPAPETATAQPAPQSQPMTATASTASDQLNVLSHDAADASGSYGTRSRNRPGRARPNYADDKEIDLEIEASGKYSKAQKKSAAAPVQQMDVAGLRDGFPAVNGVGVAPDPETAAPLVNGSHSVVPASNASSKKRKQPGSGTVVQAPSPPPTNSNPNPNPNPISPRASRAQLIETNMLSFSKSRKRLNNRQQLVADDGTTIQVNDHMYFLCEPPGEPYYFGRIMEFLHIDNDSSAAVEAVRVNWFYRPKDIQRRVQDTRVVFASMHSDTCPLAQMRGKCNIQHLANIPDLDEFRKQRDAFWFDKLFDRYMHRYYEVIPTSKVVNVPRRVKKVLDERWKFVLVEVGRGRDLTSASKVCKRCSDFAANHESVDCAVCKNTYHMSCVRPPLLKKPARGFAWACAACSRAQELKMEARHTPMSENELSRLAEAESFDDEDDEAPAHGQATPDNSTGADEHSSPTATQLAQANLWLWRYLGIHSKPEDALDYDDRIYPRASSRLGPRHQANVTVWHGRPLEYIKPAEAKKRYKPLVSTKKDHKAAALLENDRRPKRPKWVFDEPPGYVARGQDEPVELKGKREYTAQLTFKMPDPSKFSERGLDDDDRPENYGELVDTFLLRCDEEIAPLYGLSKGNVDVRTKALEKLQENNYDVQKAIEAMRKISAKVDLKLPELSKEEVKRFEEGVALYGSELHAVARYISPTIKESRVVRFYYMWKKTPRGREIWGNYENRKSKKDSKRVEKDANGAKLPDDVGDAADDSAFDNEKAAKVRRGFRCKFCSTTSSRFWRRAPATAPGTLVPRELGSKNAKDKSSWLISALCGKCAYLWRRYAVEYEPIEEIAKKIAIAGGRASKRKIDEELMRIVLEAQNFAGDVIPKSTAQIASSAGIDVPLAMVESDEPAKKKVKSDIPIPEIVVEKKRVLPEKPLELEPLKPEMPRVKEHPCAVCHIINHPDHKMLKCRDCRLHVHAPCYGVTMPTGTGPWYCDMCKNDHNTQVSTNYECVLCPVRRTPQELMEPPKVSHKKKTDREREKERAEREMVQEAGRRWREDQLAAGRPVDPREPLKRTAWNNWMHVNCAVWTKEIRFGDADHLDTAEGLGFIPRERFETPCKFCNETGYPIATCQFPSCNNNFHVGCAHQRKLTLGFDITPVKLSRRDSVPIMKLDQESGLAVPGIWCVHHAVPTIVHNMLEQIPSGFTALQEFVRTYKQVDSTITGTVRRAAQFQANVQPATNALQPPYRRTSAMNGHVQQPMQIDVITGRNAQSPSPMSPRVNGEEHGHSSPSTGPEARVKSERKCCTCAIEFSPKWWLINSGSTPKASSPELHHTTAGHSAPEHGSTRASSSAQPPSPELHHQSVPSAAAPIAALAPPTTVKPEPIDLDTMDVPAETLYQCHKCHISKKTPPSSPSQVRRVRHLAEAVQEPPAQATATPPVQQHLPQPHQEGPPHAHPGIHSAGPPPHHYQNGRPPYPGPPPVINGAPPGPHPAVLYGAPPPYHRPGEFGYPYPPPPVHYALVGGLPPPSSRANGIPQHSPPPGPYAHQLAGPPGSPHIASASGPGSYQHRQGESPIVQYGAPRGYGLAHVPQRPPSVTGMSQPPGATEQPSRRPSEGNVNTPRMGMSRPSAVSESPRLAHHDTPMMDAVRDRRSSTAGPGAASASPSLKNLLS